MPSAICPYKCLSWPCPWSPHVFGVAHTQQMMNKEVHRPGLIVPSHDDDEGLAQLQRFPWLWLRVSWDFAALLLPLCNLASSPSTMALNIGAILALSSLYSLVKVSYTNLGKGLVKSFSWEILWTYYIVINYFFQYIARTIKESFSDFHCRTWWGSWRGSP